MQKQKVNSHTHAQRKHQAPNMRNFNSKTPQFNKSKHLHMQIPNLQQQTQISAPNIQQQTKNDS